MHRITRSEYMALPLHNRKRCKKGYYRINVH
jgi:hypothetical protein